jgi:hypothetical protein
LFAAYEHDVGKAGDLLRLGCERQHLIRQLGWEAQAEVQVRLNSVYMRRQAHTCSIVLRAQPAASINMCKVALVTNVPVW